VGVGERSRRAFCYVEWPSHELTLVLGFGGIANGRRKYPILAQGGRERGGGQVKPRVKWGTGTKWFLTKKETKNFGNMPTPDPPFNFWPTAVIGSYFLMFPLSW